MWQKFCLFLSISKIFEVPSNRKWKAADSKLSYTVQFSILMLCAKYQEEGLCGKLRKMWQKFCLHEKFVYIKNILSTVKQEVEMRQTRNCHSFPYWCSVPNIRNLECSSWEKCDRNFFYIKNLSISKIFSVGNLVDREQKKRTLQSYQVKRSMALFTYVTMASKSW